MADDGRSEATKIPKRLRGGALGLVQQLQNRHERCSYGELLRYYCPPQVCRTTFLHRINTKVLALWSMETWSC